MKVDKRTTLLEFIFYLNTLKVDNEKIDQLFDQLKKYPLPEKFNKSFNELKFKQLIDLQTNIKTFDDLIFVSFEVIHQLKKEDILELSAFDCLRFALYTRDELERITKLFEAIQYKPSAEEIRAGIKNLSHGFMGTIDWYARRMGITDHDQVVELNWQRIYQCMKIDHDNNDFEKRYRNLISQQNKLK